MAKVIQFKNMDTTERGVNTIFPGEPIWDTTLKKLFVGDGDVGGILQETSANSTTLPIVGTWDPVVTPLIVGGTIIYKSASYLKVGTIVFYTIKIHWTPNATTGTEILEVSHPNFLNNVLSNKIIGINIQDSDLTGNQLTSISIGDNVIDIILNLNGSHILEVIIFCDES